MQNYEAQGGIVKGKQQSVRGYCGNLQNNTDVLRSNFSGDNFPDSPVEGQHCYRTDLKMEFIYTQNGWVENDENSTVSRELQAARGSHDNLKARLDVALNEDGTLKAGAEINMNEWKQSLMTPTYLDESRFYVPNDVESVFTVGRALKITNKDKSVVTYVDSSKYDVDYNRTIVTVTDSVIASSVSAVELSVIQHSMPKTAATVKQIKENTEEIYKHNHTGGKGAQIPTQGIASEAITTEKLANSAVTGEKIASQTITRDKLDPRVLASTDMDVRSTGFKNHVASGFDMDIDGKTGKLVVSQGRAFLNGRYRDMWNSKTLDVKGAKGIVYADKETDSEATVRFKAFEKPSTFVTDGVPAEDVLFMTDFEIDGNNIPTQLIEDLSGNGCNLTAYGKTEGLEVKNVISWNVPVDVNRSSSCYWDSGANNFKGFEAGKPWSAMFYFIPHTMESDEIPFCIATTTTCAYDVYFRLRNYDIVSETYRAEFYNNKIDTGLSNTTSLLYPTSVFRNKPNLLVMEFDGHSAKFYVNGVLAYHSKQEFVFPAATKGRICVNQYSTSSSYKSTVTPLFACVRHGVWGERTIAELSNRMGVPNEHVGYFSELPTLYHGQTDGAYSNGYHAWDFSETAGSTIYDKNPNNPMHGTVMEGQRVQTLVKSSPSVELSGTGYISLGNYSIPEEFSFFALVTIYADGTILANYPKDTSGCIFVAQGHYLRTHFNGWRNTSKRISYGEPIVVGMTIKGQVCSIYSDSTIPESFNLPSYAGFRDNNPLTLGQYGNNSTRIKAIYHGAVMADRVFTPSEIRSIFKSFKKRTYKNIADDMGLSDKAVIGMVKTNNKGEVEEIENYPMWGRRKNPFGSQKYFLGWYQTVDARRYIIPNYYGSSRVKINAYMCHSKNSPAIRSVGNEMTRQLSRGTGGSYPHTEYYPVPSFSFNWATCKAIEYFARSDAGFYNQNDIRLDNLAGYGVEPVWLGFEVEPIADDDSLDNVDY